MKNSTFKSQGAGGGGTKIAIDTTSNTYNGASGGTAYTISIPGGTLGDNDGIKYDIEFSNVSVDNGQTLGVDIKYGGVIITTVTLYGSGDQINTTGARILGSIVADNSANAQKAFASFISTMNNTGSLSGTDVTSVNTEVGTGAINSSVDQNLEIDVSSSGGTNTCTVQAIIVEKITS